MSEMSSAKRRQVLSGLMKLLVFIGFIFLSIPFISSFSTNSLEEKLASSSNWVITISTNELETGKIKALPWYGGLGWVYVRENKDIQSLKKSNDLLMDAASSKSDQPPHMQNDLRSAAEKYFVFIPQENKKGCQVRLTEDDNNVVFTEPCFNAKFDAAGRIFKNSGHKDQINLAVPQHVIEDGFLKVGVWIPKI